MAKKSSGWKKDNRPARQNYWNRGTLKKRKVKNLMISNGMTRKAAEVYWESARKGRRR